MSQELYKRHRPRNLKMMIGAENSVAALQNMLDRNSLPHTLLFHGPSGCGKTTMARILKRELNCHDMDFQELNCSNFRGIDTIREISRQMHLAPVGDGCKIWLLDEVHQLSKDGQHAALKILEDTPDHVYFFLCTTDPQKLLKTIRTRCCEMPVRLLTHEEQEKLIRRVAKREKIQIPDDVVEEIVFSSQGSARTALVLLDKIANLDPEQMLYAVEQKLAEENETIDLCRELMKGSEASWTRIGKILQNLKEDPEKVRYAVLGYARAVLLKKKSETAYFMLEAFRRNFYDSKAAGLIHACYEVVFAQ